jgi:dipeptidyl aminopeptidase/acylaminoacyl peptidase
VGVDRGGAELSAQRLHDKLSTETLFEGPPTLRRRPPLPRPLPHKGGGGRQLAASLISVLITLALHAIVARASGQERSLITLSDIHRVAEITDPVFSADGSSVLYTLTTHNTKDDKTISDIWRVPYAGGEPANLTNTEKTSEWRPEPSADGSIIAFLSDAPVKGQKKDDAETQVWIMAGAGGKPQRVTNLPGGVSDFALSPDGKRIAVVAEVGSRVGFPKDKTAPPIVIDRFQFKEDGRGYLDDRRQQLFLASIADDKATQLTTGPFDNALPTWSPDGKLIAFVSKRGGDPDRNLDFDVYVMPPEPGARPRVVGAYPGSDNDPEYESRLAWSPDSRRLAWLRGGDDRWLWYRPNDIAVGDAASGEASVPLTADRFMSHPRWSANGATLYALLEGDRETSLVRLDSAAHGYVDVINGRGRFAADFAVGPHDELVVLDGDDNAPRELRAIPPGGGGLNTPSPGSVPRQLTHHNDWLEERRVAATQEVSAKNGRTEIHGLLVTPPGWDGKTPLPLIVRLHGGPVYQFSHEFMLDWQLYAARGYAVLGVNPRGSSGRGFDFARAIFADWGRPDVDDVRALIDSVVASGVADGSRIGVGGWSYGGILTDYAIARDHRFKAAVSGAGMGDMFAGYGVDQYAREYELELGVPWAHQRAWRRVSFPFLHADEITTPTLFFCAAADDNVPCVGAQQMYEALRSRGLPTQLVVYPDENHGLKIPSYIEDRLRRSLDWYDKHLSAE